ncbi:pyrroloquinoline quinone biosynthesis peptide chaperone PqqD [Pseudomonas aeruginosa]|uniref:pyrroloquinoline quinone biosynthesis peptide chaperone PqqD n=1 Tax=Pseudomonadaceae TaxID=135621 RepID=UPI0005BCF4BC|nr:MULTISPECIES: pyrroloquinoline quinone biosynthesis peptide chaperone PqqD [Pseudomonas aeruginosa group]MBP2697529.1 pyrroloquinoline quinone biosynthesis peptide chaperone PqqD [Pseudomonas aeruginosa]MCV0060114.1 pyrroloquinoline quinone biosynthesis peptide chaperone PqqD [Pseudomonas aeruginosa]MCV0270879.1 pyrroloquinoline quinone biosynthesis peptide chaperone PqqD [Pseudomonas aeruginosa]MDI2561819.1 pyrroloquinoline quinone biosynthesis peptide chaperone PqqD [Pseudomonas aeruginosa
MSDFDLRQVPHLRPGYRLQWEPAQQAHVLLYPEGMIKLNESAGAIASLIDGQRSVAAIVAELEARYPGATELADDVVQFMEVAREKFWLQLA